MTRYLKLAAGDTFRSLEIRNYRLYLFGQMTSQTGTWLTTIAQTLLVLKLDGSGIGLGLLSVAQFGPLMVFSAWAGALADRAPKRKALIALQSTAMVVALSLAIVTLAGAVTVRIVFVAAFLRGMVGAFESPIRQSFIAEVVPADRYANAMSLNGSAMTTARVIGPAIAGLLVTTVGFGWTFLLDGLSFLAVISGLVAMRTSELRPVVRVARARGQIREGLSYLRGDPTLLVPTTMLLVTGVFAFNFGVSMPLLVTGPLEGSDASFTTLFALLSAGGLVGALVSARAGRTSRRLLIGSAAGFGVTMVGLAASPTLALAYVAAVALGLASNLFMIGAMAGVQSATAPEYRGRVSALLMTVIVGTTPAGGMIVGWTNDHFGARTCLWIGAVSCFVATAYAMRSRFGLPEQAEAGPYLRPAPIRG